MTEHDIKELIVQTLNEGIPDYPAEDYPSDINSYYPTNPNGGILIKSLGENDTYNSPTDVETGVYSPIYVQSERRWGFLLVCRESRNVDIIYELTDRIKELLNGKALVGDYKMYFLSSDEPGYDQQKLLLYRSVVFRQPEDFLL